MIRWSHPQVFLRAGAYGVAGILVGFLLPSEFPVSWTGLASALVFSAVIVLIDFMAAVSREGQDDTGSLDEKSQLEGVRRRLDKMRFEFGHERDINRDGLSPYQALGLGMILVPELIFTIMAAAAISRVVAST